MLSVLAALALMPSTTYAAERNICADSISRVAEVAEHLGYELDMTEGGLAGTRAAGQRLTFQCDGDRAELQLRGVDGSAASMEFMGDETGAAAAMHVQGSFPQFGDVAETWVMEGFPAHGFVNFSVTTGEAKMSAVMELPGGDWMMLEETGSVSPAFAPVLHASVKWREVHMLAFAMIGLWEPAMAGNEATLDLLLGLVIPAPDHRGDADVIYAKRVCGGAVAACALTVLLPLPPTVGGCGAAIANCFTAVACTELDCAGDGRGP